MSITPKDPLSEDVRQIVEDIRLGYPARLALLLEFFDQNYPKPEPLTWWELLANKLENETRFVSDSKRDGINLAVNMLREEGKKNV